MQNSIYRYNLNPNKLPNQSNFIYFNLWGELLLKVVLYFHAEKGKQPSESVISYRQIVHLEHSTSFSLKSPASIVPYYRPLYRA